MSLHSSETGSFEQQQAIFITGVGQRAGLHLAHHFIDQGWAVLGSYRSERPAIAELAEKGCHLFQADYQDLAQTQRQLDSVTQSLQTHSLTLRAVIHNASDWVCETPGESDPTLIDRMMNIHLRVPYLFNPTLVNLMGRKNTGEKACGDIIHITDYVSTTGSAKHLAYAASKAALDNLTQSMAKLWAPEVKVNAIAPALLEFNEHDGEAYKAKAVKKNILGRTGGFDSLIQSVCFLMDNDFITGQTLPLDGGRHLA